MNALMALGTKFNAMLCVGALAMMSSCAANGVLQDDKQLPDILADATISSSVYLPDFSYAGYRFGFEPVPEASGEIVDVTTFGAVADDGLDDSHAVLAAIKAANAVDGPVILQFPAGRFQISEILPIERGNIVIKGAGMGKGGTQLYFPRPLEMVDRTSELDELREYLNRYDKKQREKEQNIDYIFSEYSWTGGFIWVQKPGTKPALYLDELDTPIENIARGISGTRGTRDVKVASAARLKVGDVVQLLWRNGQGQNGALIKSMYGDSDIAVGDRHWTFPDRPIVRQTTRIEAINGDVVTIGDPLMHDVSADLPASFAAWDHIEHVGIEDLSIMFPDAIAFGHHLERGYNGIYLTSAFDSWIRRVSVHNADSAVLTYNSASTTISDIEVTGDRAAHYAVHLGNVHNFLVRDMKVDAPVIHSLSLNTQSTKSVFLRAEVMQSPTLDQHAGANHQNLFDNITAHIDANRDENGPYWNIWDGTGAGYWQPGHGRFNTTWNLNAVIESGAKRGETVRLLGAEEGPDARIVGVRSNYPVTVSYIPEPYIEGVNTDYRGVPSLYEYQLSKRAN